MSEIQVTLPLQTMIRLMLAAQVCQNVTLPGIPKLALADPIDSSMLPLGYVAFPEYGLAYKLFDILRTHEAARKSCLNENGQLAVIDSREKVQKVIDNFGSIYRAWVGLQRLELVEEWTTIDGKSTSDLPWEDAEPIGSSRCVRLSKEYDGLGTFSCDNKYQYLCEIALGSN